MGFHNQPRCGTIQQFTSVGCKRFSQLQRTYKAMTDPIDEKSAPSHSDTTRGMGLARSLIRLGLGGVMIGARTIRRPESLREALAPTAVPDDGDAQPQDSGMSTDDSRFDTALSTAVGAALATQHLVAQGVNKSVAVNKQVWNFTAPLRKPLDWIGVTDLATATAQSLAIHLDHLEQTGRVEMLESREQALGTLTTTIDTVIAYLGQSPAVVALVRDLLQEILPELADDPAIANLVEEQVRLVLPGLADDSDVQNIIRKQASAYLFYLQNHSEQIEALIRTQGDIYIEYLNQHPENVQALIQGQSLGLAGQVMDGVRERAVTADSVAEMIARRVLGRAPRGDLPPPAYEVIRRADATVIPSDLIRKEDEDAATGR